MGRKENHWLYNLLRDQTWNLIKGEVRKSKVFLNQRFVPEGEEN